MSYNEYEAEVVRLAKKMNPKLKGICTDTIKDSFKSGVTTGMAARKAQIDSEFWEFGF